MKDFSDSLIVTNNSSIYLLKQEKVALELKEKVINSSFYPTLRLSTSIGSGYSGNSKELIGSELKTKSFENQMDDNFYQSVIFSLSIPISKSLGAYHEKRELSIEKRILELKEEEVLQQLYTEVLILKKELKFLSSRIHNLEENIILANEYLKNSRMRFELGNITFSELSIVQEKVHSLNLKLELVNAEYYIKDFLLNLLVC